MQAVRNIVEATRADFWSPSTTDAERAARVARDLRTTFGGERGEGLLWPFKRVIESPFMFLEPTEAFRLLEDAAAAEAEAERAFQGKLERVRACAAAVEPDQSQTFSFLHEESIAVCAAAQMRENWIAHVTNTPRLLLLPAAADALKTGLRSVQALDRFYKEVSEVFPFEKVWFRNPFLSVENIPDEVVLRALEYLPESERVMCALQALENGREEVVERLVLAPAVFTHVFHSVVPRLGTGVAVALELALHECGDGEAKASSNCPRSALAERFAKYFPVRAMDVFVNKVLLRSDDAVTLEKREAALRIIFLGHSHAPTINACPAVSAADLRLSLCKAYMKKLELESSPVYFNEVIQELMN